MNMHENARLTPRGRERIVRQVESGQMPEAVAEAAGVLPALREGLGLHLSQKERTGPFMTAGPLPMLYSITP
jgi:hypothetical protein